MEEKDKITEAYLDEMYENLLDLMGDIMALEMLCKNYGFLKLKYGEQPSYCCIDRIQQYTAQHCKEITSLSNFIANRLSP